jgi:hypothetical protein
MSSCLEIFKNRSSKDALAKLEAITKRELTAVMHEILESSMMPGARFSRWRRIQGGW